MRSYPKYDSSHQVYCQALELHLDKPEHGRHSKCPLVLDGDKDAEEQRKQKLDLLARNLTLSIELDNVKRGRDNLNAQIQWLCENITSRKFHDDDGILIDRVLCPTHESMNKNCNNYGCARCWHEAAERAVKE